jgi:hypothetical protein
MKTPKQPIYFDYQVFDFSVIGNAIKDIHDHLATPVGGFPRGYSTGFR